MTVRVMEYLLTPGRIKTRAAHFVLLEFPVRTAMTANLVFRLPVKYDFLS